jgi:methylenetetrahydrofolate dehydrogenase (NADP+)/methenyltetrahydrofolate cyclohydrolase
MTATIIDGKEVSSKLLESIKKRAKAMKEKPGLAIVLVGNNPASEIYVNFKEKTCKEIGFNCERYNLPEDVSQDELLRIVDDLNQKKSIHGILVQLPLPKQINENLVVDSILPYKDVDGFTPVNLGNLVNDNNVLEPATARACMALIESTGKRIEGKNAVVVGRSSIVGKPVALLLLQKNATVTICHSKTKDLAEHTRNADILVVACGKAKLITKDMVKENAVVIDVGINRVNKKVVGDVDFESVKEVASFLTPVPRGVGPMTIAMLLDNTLMAARRNLR